MARCQAQQRRKQQRRSGQHLEEPLRWSSWLTAIPWLMKGGTANDATSSYSKNAPFHGEPSCKDPHALYQLALLAIRMRFHVLACCVLCTAFVEAEVEYTALLSKQTFLDATLWLCYRFQLLLTEYIGAAGGEQPAPFDVFVAQLASRLVIDNE